MVIIFLVKAVTWVNLNGNICENLTGVVVFLAWRLGEMNMVIILLRILNLVLNVMFVFNTIYRKKLGSCIGMIDIYSIGKRLKK